MTDLWLAIPAPIRSALRVAFGALIAWALADGVQILTDSTLPTWAKGLLLAVAVPTVRALDPTEAAFGNGSGVDE
jgi:hypothetical protein